MGKKFRVCAILVCAVAVTCSAADAPVWALGAQPLAVFERDLGWVRPGAVVQVQQSVTNTTGGVLELKPDPPSCTCTALSLEPSVLQPGESGILRIQIEHGRRQRRVAYDIGLSSPDGSARWQAALITDIADLLADPPPPEVMIMRGDGTGADEGWVRLETLRRGLAPVTWDTVHAHTTRTDLEIEVRPKGDSKHFDLWLRANSAEKPPLGSQRIPVQLRFSQAGVSREEIIERVYPLRVVGDCSIRPAHIFFSGKAESWPPIRLISDGGLRPNGVIRLWWHSVEGEPRTDLGVVDSDSDGFLEMSQMVPPTTSGELLVVVGADEKRLVIPVYVPAKSS